MGPSSVSPRPLPPRRRLPRRQDVRATFTSTCGFSSVCSCSCSRCSSSPSTGWRTLSRPLPLSLTSAAREGAPSRTWRYAAFHLRGPPSPHCPPEGGGLGGGGADPWTHMHVRVHFLLRACMQQQASMHRHKEACTATPHCDNKTKHTSATNTAWFYIPGMFLLIPLVQWVCCSHVISHKHRRCITHNVMKEC